MTSFFSTMVSLNTSPGDDPRRDRLRDLDRCDLGDGDRTESPSQSRTDRGASDRGTVSIFSIFSFFSIKTSPCTLGARMLGDVVGGASIKRVVITDVVQNVKSTFILGYSPSLSLYSLLLVKISSMLSGPKAFSMMMVLSSYKG